MVGEGSMLMTNGRQLHFAVVKWSINGKWRMKWKVGLQLIRKFSCDATKRKEVGKEVRECAAEKKRASALRLCFSVEFICWLRASKRRLLASLLVTAGKCWTKGRVHRNWWNWFISCINFLHDSFVAARRFCWVVSSIVWLWTAGTFGWLFVVVGRVRGNVLRRYSSEGKLLTELRTLDFCCWQVACFIATQESFEGKWCSAIPVGYSGSKEGRMKRN